MTGGVNYGGNFTHFPRQHQPPSPEAQTPTWVIRTVEFWGVFLPYYYYFFFTVPSSSWCGLRNPGLFYFSTPRHADKHVLRPAMLHVMGHCRGCEGCCSISDAARRSPTCPQRGFLPQNHQCGDAVGSGTPLRTILCRLKPTLPARVLLNQKKNSDGHARLYSNLRFRRPLWDAGAKGTSFMMQILRIISSKAAADTAALSDKNAVE